MAEVIQQEEDNLERLDNDHLEFLKEKVIEIIWNDWRGGGP